MKKETVATGGALGGGALGTALVFATGCLGTKRLCFSASQAARSAGFRRSSRTGHSFSPWAQQLLRWASGESSAGGKQRSLLSLRQKGATKLSESPRVLRRLD